MDIEFPQRPEDLSALTSAELEALCGACEASIRAAAASTEKTPALATAVKGAQALRTEAKAALSALASVDSDIDAALAELDADNAPVEPNLSTPPVAPVIPATPKAPSAADLAATEGALSDADGQKPATGIKPYQAIAATSVDGFEAGQHFESFNDIAEALMQRHQDVDPGTGERFVVAKFPANFSDELTLTGDAERDRLKWGPRENVDDLAAAVCAPREPIYDLGCGSSIARPLGNSLQTFKAPRGGVIIYPSPKLADITAGRGLWTRDDDANSSATKAACATIPCASTSNYDIYGIYRCLKVTNMAAMTFPELVEAYLNRLGALQARLAEVTLLDAMKSSANNIDVTADAINYGASIALLETLARLMEVYKAEERYGDIQFDMWAPRHFRTMLIVDQLLMRRTTNTSLRERQAAAADVDAALENMGISPTWTLDNATGWTALSAFTDGSQLPAWPNTVKMVIAPKGNFRRLDSGTLNLGVGGNTVRDQTSLSHNDFVMFWESLEGLVDFGCKSIHLSFTDVCVGGQQVADIAYDCAVPVS